MTMPEQPQAGVHTHPEIEQMRGEMTAMEARHGARLDEMGTAHRSEIERLHTEYAASRTVDAATDAAIAAQASAEAAQAAAESTPDPAVVPEPAETDEVEVEVDPAASGEPPEKPKELPAVPKTEKENKSWADNYKWGARG